MTLNAVPRPASKTCCTGCCAPKPPGSRDWHTVLFELRKWDKEGGTASTAELAIMHFCESCEALAGRIVKALGGAARDMNAPG